MIHVELHRSEKSMRMPLSEVRRVAGAVCRGERISNARFSFVFVGTAAMRRIHRAYLHDDTSTDIITFSFESDSIDAEMYINVVRARMQARRFGVTIRNEMIRLIVHGMLHAAGYKDTTPRSRARMIETQERYVEKCNLSQRQRMENVDARKNR
jgi:rRNA maturation RNase YbeY